jgi:hypothetical protein
VSATGGVAGLSIIDPTGSKLTRRRQPHLKGKPSRSPPAWAMDYAGPHRRASVRQAKILERRVDG